MSVSVIIPTFNRAAYVGEAIESVYAGNESEPEVIVIDDGSTDATGEVVRRFPAARYVRQENRGPAAARNHGVALARGEFLAFLDSDDVWLPGKLRYDLETFAAHPEIDAVITDAEVWSEQTLRAESWLRMRGLPLEDAPRAAREYPPVWAGIHLFAPCCMALRRRALDRVGPFDETLRSFEDWDFELRLIPSCEVLISPERTAKIRRFDDGTRTDRPVFGQPFSPEQAIIGAGRRLQVLRRALARDDWRDDERAALLETLRAVEAQLATPPSPASRSAVSR